MLFDENRRGKVLLCPKVPGAFVIFTLSTPGAKRISPDLTTHGKCVSFVSAFPACQVVKMAGRQLWETVETQALYIKELREIERLKGYQGIRGSGFGD